MDEKKKLGSKLMAIHFEYEQMMASQNPYESMTKEWVEWQKEQSRKRYEYHLAQKALVNELFKGEGTVPTEEQMNIMLEPARKKIAEECEKIEQFKKQRFNKVAATNNNQVDKEDKQPVEGKTITQNDDTAI